MSSLLSTLVEHGVSDTDIEKATAYQSRYGGRIEQILVNMGSLGSDSLPGVYSKLLGLPVFSKDPRDWEPPDSAVALPLEMLIAKGWIPYNVSESGCWTLLTTSPLDVDVNNWLSSLTAGYDVQLVSLDQFGLLKGRLAPHQQDLADSIVLTSLEEGRLRELASEAPTVNFLNGLMSRAIKQRASDLHIEPQNGNARVRFRIDGVLHEVDSIPSSMVLPVITRLKILAGMDIGERRRPQDGKIELRLGGEEIDIRTSMLPLAEGESAVLRFLRKTALVLDLHALGMARDVESWIFEDLAVTSGVVLLTGPTGSGKTTTLYSFLNRLNTEQVKIITLEDPVEYQLKGINQVQVQPAIGFDFAHGLRSIVRQDPDIIMVGEIRDRETASIAMQSALTGHLVFSTVHTNDAPGAYTRLLDLGVEEFLLNAALRSIVGQRLVRRLCADCAVPDPKSAELIDELGLTALAKSAGVLQPQLLRPDGCDVCGGTGYRGRIAITEYFRCDSHVAAIPKDAEFLTNARAYAKTRGWRTLLEDGYVHAMSGVTTVAEVLRVAG